MTERKETTATRFAANVRARRELNGISQDKLAEAMRDLGHGSFRQQTVAEIESGNRQVKLEEALSISRALGTSMDNLARPAKLTKQASELLDAAREVRETARQAAQWARDHESARRRLTKALTAAGDETALADEIAVAQRAIAETAD